MGWFWNPKPKLPSIYQEARREAHFLFGSAQSNALYDPEHEEYERLRALLPIVDAGLGKIVRLTGGFRVMTAEAVQPLLDAFTEQVPNGSGGRGLQQFIDSYLDELLLYGSAAGEMVFTKEGAFAGLYLADPRNLEVREGKRLFTKEFYWISGGGRKKAAHPERILFTALNPAPGSLKGRSLLSGLPEMGEGLLQIFYAVRKNYQRAGNLRYAVTYQPGNDLMDRAYAKERAEQIAVAWQDGMRAAERGEVKDFVASGEVKIQPIGTEQALMETEVPVRQLLEQITAKIGVPPFLLGLNWNTSERMSKQQTDILVNELWYYRRLLTPVIETICRSYLALSGSAAKVSVEWETINLQDERESAEADYFRARAEAVRGEVPKKGEV